MYQDFIENLRSNNYSKETLYNYGKDLEKFFEWLKKEQIEFEKMSKNDLYNYKSYLTNIKKLSGISTNRSLSAIKSYLRYRIQTDQTVPVLPDVIIMTKTVKKKKQLISLDVISRLIECPLQYEKKNKLIAIRNKAILEVLFATGLRISELVNIKMEDINKDGMIFVLGKGKKERFVYLTERARKAVDEYLKIKNNMCSYLFTSLGRGKISKNYIQTKIKDYRDYLGIDLPVSAHTMRHGFATYLAEAGASPVAIQILLGHESLNTTSRYVNASDKYAQDIHKQFHPLK